MVTGAEYVNPIGVPLADPVVIRDGNEYYLYGTNSNKEGFIVYSSPDLVNWTERGYAYRKQPNSWGKWHFWAPAIVKRDGTFYLFYSAVGDAGGHASHRICVAKSQTPLGPFEDVKTPLLNSLTAAIDPHVFQDGDQAYLYFSLDVSENRVSRIYVVELAADLLSVVGQPELCIEPNCCWEGNLWNEAPYVVKCGTKYVLMYSAQGYFDPNYSVGYATADHPCGPWTKSEQNPILKRTEQISGPGHNCLVESPDGKEMFIVYHVHEFSHGGWQRELAIDRIEMKEEAGTVTITVKGPTNTPQPFPSGVK